MHGLLDIDWAAYFHCLSDNDLHELAAWLAAEGLEVSEFTDLIDRAYAQTSNEWRGRPLAFVATCGRPVVARYANRKRHFAGLLAALEDARMCGALPGEVELRELAPLYPPAPAPRSAERMLSVLERARGSSP
jgi:hypothetical protein